ncbi:hypothetical protein [Rhodococcus sp. P1Y]|uniref:hypothetical protein n=1 Tax=Rhodococcus sp. P1Y TaxID=1302308 RepID=UPI000EAE4F6B|nr:hypothetical protein [Rhodococcus sp. P1Y]AYJ48806.1 hypothetical protein D8W71_11210 [Rhodococcus sp. P1Y]
MTILYVLDIPENTTIASVAEIDPAVRVDHVGPYFRIVSDGDIVIDRRATGCRHAVWYSSVSGLTDSQILQWDKDAMRVVGS